MEYQYLLEQRQSIRRYQDGDIPEAHIQEMIRAAATAPSAKNIQNWHFVAIKNREVIRKIADLITAKNESIAAEMDKVDEEKANRFRKFCKNFTVFWKETAPALTVVYSTVYTPAGYDEYKLLGKDQSLLDDLMGHRNPGMQSVGCALQNFTLKAIEKGYGTTILTSANYAAEDIEAYLKEEGLFEKEGFYMVSLIAMGVPQENQKSPKKKELDDVYTFIK